MENFANFLTLQILWSYARINNHLHYLAVTDFRSDACHLILPSFIYIFETRAYSHPPYPHQLPLLPPISNSKQQYHHHSLSAAKMVQENDVIAIIVILLFFVLAVIAFGIYRMVESARDLGRSSSSGSGSGSRSLVDD